MRRHSDRQSMRRAIKLLRQVSAKKRRALLRSTTVSREQLMEALASFGERV